MIEASDLHLPWGLAPGFSLRVHPGEQVALLGPNGAGKTTLIRALAGVLQPRSGRVLLEGTDLATLSARAIAQRIAWVPQTSAVPELTVRETVALGRSPWRRGWSDSKGDTAAIEGALEITRLVELAARPLRTLSGGERQRVALARALAQQPKVLLLDEPTAHLDLGHRETLLEVVRQTGLTVVAILHDPNLAALYFPRLVLLAGGGIVVEGTPEKVLQNEHLRVAYGVEVPVVSHPFGGPQVLPRGPTAG